jgi:hypothetical protein
MADANSTSSSVLINDLSSNQTPKSIVHDQPPPYKLSLNNKDNITDKVQHQSQSGSRSNVKSTQPFVTMQLDRTHLVDEIESYKCWSLFNIFCCCLPLGIMAWFYSYQTKQGNFQDALKTSKQAQNLNIIATITGIIIIALYMRLMNSLIQKRYRFSLICIRIVLHISNPFLIFD